MGIISTIVKQATRFPRIETYDRFLFIGPHPDDIEIGGGATAAKLVREGKSEEEVVDIRKKESIASANALGVYDVRFLDICDGGFYKKKDLSKGIANVIGEVNPDIVFAPDYWVSSECHIDHLNVGRITSHIAYFAPYKNIMKRFGASSANVKALALYMTANPNQFINTRGFVKKQLDSIFKCHVSQFPAGTPEAESLNTYIILRSKLYGPRRLSTDAEGFRVLYTTHMHCLPEASKF